MKTSKVIKDFDCVEFKRKAQAEIYGEIKRLSPQDEIEYFRKTAESGPMGEWWKALKRRSELGSPMTRRS